MRCRTLAWCNQRKSYLRIGHCRREPRDAQVQGRLYRIREETDLPTLCPDTDEFRKILTEYKYALLVKFISPANAEADVICSIYRYWLDPDAPPDKKGAATRFWKDHFNGTGAFAPMMLELERTAFNAGNPFALAFVNGSCRLCEICNVKGGICIHPAQARIPEHAVGVNMVKTAERAEMPIRFPVQGHPELMALLLID